MGYSAGIGDDEIQNVSKLERLCDKTAALFLLPEDRLRSVWSEVGEKFELLSKRLKLSRYVIARCAKDYGIITTDHFFNLIRKWNTEPILTNNIKSSGGDFNRMAVKRTSRVFLIHVSNAIGRNLIAPTEAYRLSNLKGDTFRKVLNSKAFI